MSDLPRFGFSRWDLRPEKDESTLGFFDRMLEREGEDSLNSFAALNGLKESSIVVEEVLDHLLRYPFPDHVKAYLRDAAALTQQRDPLRNLRTFCLRGQVLGKRDLCIALKRWCPACVAENPYRRIWFDVVSLRTCPYHDTKILDRSLDGNEVPSSRVGICDLVTDYPSRPESALREFTFGHYVLGRLGCEPAFPVEVFDQAELRHVIATCGLIGRIMADVEPRPGSKASGSHHELGFDAVRQGPSLMAESIAERARRKHGEMAQVLPLKKLVQQALFVGERGCGNVVGPFLRRVANAANALCKMDNRPELSDERVVSGGITIKTLAERVGLRRTSASLAMKKLGLLEDRVLRMSASEADVPIVRAFVETLVDSKTCATILGLPANIPRHLIRAGVVDVYYRTDRGRSVQWVSKDDVDAVTERLAQLPRVANVKKCRGLPYAARLLNQSVGALALRVLNGSVAIGYAKCAKAGFGGIVIDVGERAGYEGADESVAVSLTEASSMLAVETGTVGELVDRGLLALVGSAGPLRRYVARFDVEEFARTYALGPWYRKALRMGRSQFDRHMAEAGVKPVVKKGTGLAKDTIYRRSDVVRAFGLASDPLARTDPDLEQFWSRVVHLVKSRASEVTLPACFQPSGCWASTTLNTRLVKFGYCFQTKVFTAEFPSLVESKVLRFDPSAPAEDGAEEALVSPLRQAISHAKARSIRYRKLAAARLVTAEEPLEHVGGLR